MFLYIDPLKQGLKLCSYSLSATGYHVFIHRSIKTRIETIQEIFQSLHIILFLYIDPLKQGLKPKKEKGKSYILVCFYT